MFYSIRSAQLLDKFEGLGPGHRSELVRERALGKSEVEEDSRRIGELL